MTIVGKFLHMWKNFICRHMTILHIWHVCDVENVAIYAKFCHNLHAFMWRKIEPKKYICGEKWQIWGLITWCRTVVQARKSISILFFSWRAFASSIKKISEKALFNGQYEQKVRYAMPCEEIFGFLAINLFSVCLESLLLIFRYNLNLASKEIEHLLSIT